MKRFLPALIVLGILLALIFAVYQNRIFLTAQANDFLYYSQCDKPIYYRIGRIDTRFNITRDELTKNIADAADIWGNARGKKLFLYDKDATLTVSLEYDQRQSLNTQINQLDNQLKQQDESIKPEIADYDTRVANFKSRLASLNQQINDWNSKGGAPPDEYKKINDEQAALQQEADNLNALGQKLNQTAGQYNAKIEQLNQTVDTYNQALQYKPEEGLYISEGGQQQIIVYFYITKQELVHTLAHEMGHALGLDHIDNPEAIMFSRTNKVTALSSDDITALTHLCRERSVVEPVKERLSYLLTRIQESLGTLWGGTRGAIRQYY